MVDNLKPEDRKKTMRAVKGKDTRLERWLFAMLAGMSVQGWKKNAADVEGKPDVVFPQEKVAIFVDGCFWHGCPICNRKLPQTNQEYWERKIKRNVNLAEIHNQKLLQDGWVVIRIWEHEVKDKCARLRIRTAIRNALQEEQTG